MAGRFTLSILKESYKIITTTILQDFGRFYHGLYMDLSKPIKPFFNFYQVHLYRDFLSSSLNLFIRRSSRSLLALLVKSTSLSFELNAWLRIPAIVSQSAGDFGFLAATSVASMKSFQVVGHLKGAIFYKIKSDKGYAVLKA